MSADQIRQAARDMQVEVQTLSDLLRPLPEGAFQTVTQFKGWTINDVLGHLHMFDMAALASLQGDAEFQRFFDPIAARIGQGQTLLQSQYPWLDGLTGRDLYTRWNDTALRLADEFAQADPKRRLKWVGPSMSAISSLTARQMETWAHGHEVFDILGQARVETDRIRNICHLGVNTFGWSFVVRGQPVPSEVPFVSLTLPSGATQAWGQDTGQHSVHGSAVEFAQVVTQTRGFADTALTIQGPIAQQWMETAQCFAGGVEAPPTKGERFLVT